MRRAQVAFALAMIGLGVVGFVYGSAADSWQVIPKAWPAREAIAYACSIIEVAGGLALLVRRTAAFAAGALAVFLFAWLIALKVPPLMRAPQIEVNWESLGETLVLLAGALCPLPSALRASPRAGVGRAVDVARLLFIAALPMFGLSHIIYHDMTASLVPRWLGVPLAWTYATGAASIAAAVAMAVALPSRIRSRVPWLPLLAASLEATMLWAFTLLVWLPKAALLPKDEGIWSELFLSAAIASGAWLVAESYRDAGRVFGKRRT